MSDQDTIWRYVAAADYAVPSDLSADTLRGFRRLWKAALASVHRAGDAGGGPQERSRPPRELLAGALPELDPDAMSRVLEAALEERSELEPAGHRARLVVGPPGTQVGPVLTALARRGDWKELAPPARAELLGGPEALDDRLQEAAAEPSRPLMIPELHRWLLRSARALPLLRRLLEQLRATASPVWVGCDSWAWSFLKCTAGADLLGRPLALAALDGAALAAWLGPPLRSRGLVCRSVEKRSEAILGLPASRQPETDGDPPPSPFMVKLALAARGNPASARELWTRCLSVADADEAVADGENGENGKPESTLWAAPLHDSEITVPRDLGAVHRFVLHAVLLHGGLEHDLVPEVLPLPRHEIFARVRDLVVEGLLEERDGERDGELAVPQLVYPAVREYLDGEGLLVDDF